MLRQILVGDTERVLLIRNKRFDNILGPGEYRLFTLMRGIELERHNVKSLIFASKGRKKKEAPLARYRTLPRPAARYYYHQT